MRIYCYPTSWGKLLLFKKYVAPKHGMELLLCKPPCLSHVGGIIKQNKWQHYVCLFVTQCRVYCMLM